MARSRKWAGEFLEAVFEKMERGQKEHGDQSLSMKPHLLIEEMMEECVDIAGWGAIAWMRLRELSRAVERVENAEQADKKDEKDAGVQQPVPGSTDQ
jgi:hypothetical protein